MLEQAGREILWNVGTIGNVVAMYGLLAVALLIGAAGIVRHTELWRWGQPAPDRERSALLRFFDLYKWGLLQRGVVRERTPAVAHTLVYLGFLILLFTTTMVFIDHDLGIRIYRGSFYLAVTVLSDLFGLGLLIGCAISAHRRYLAREDRLHSTRADLFLIGILALLVIQGFLLEGLRIHATDDPWAKYSPVGLLVARFFWAMPVKAAAALHYGVWWFHTLTVYAAIALAPWTKLFHIVGSSANLYFRFSSTPKGALSNPGDIEKMVEAGDEFKIGLGTIKDYSWKQLMDLDACTSCGRCQAACPAYLTGKPLSPKWIMLDTRNHALALNAKGALSSSKLPAPLRALDSALTLNFFLKGSGLRESAHGGFDASGAWRAENQLVQGAVNAVGRSADDKIAGDVISEEAFWSCTTCRACVEACPVGINQLDQIVENRRNMVLMEGKIPSEATRTLRALENQANPYGAPEDRIKWLEGLDVKVLKPGDQVDVLYWVGCVSSYDARKQKIARALVTLMKEAGLNFGILGTAEGCTGDPARRLGEENLFQMLAKSNIETLKSVRFSTLVANCPHCFNTIKNEYPQFGNLGEGREPEIIHHSALLKRLVEQQRLSLRGDAAKKITFHDPCYLGRYNDEYEAPREVVKSSSAFPILEMERSREKGMCCGAGGGHFWMDLKIGTRVNALRADQAAETGAERIATACPFCMQMMEDGVKITGREGAIDVRDIAEVMLESLKS